jgi:poly-beta-1,6-N-acetyl-D-glucosamine synthase
MISIGICAYNEEGNIGHLLKRLSKYPFEIIVVASGCTDSTIPIVKNFNVKLIEQREREGKASAINIFLSEARGDILILQSADTLPTDFTFKYLLKPFEDKRIGMTGAHPIPVDEFKGMGAVAHLLWKVHHETALMSAKSGEVCAFRNVISRIDPETPVDEAYIEFSIVRKGYKVQYAPLSIILNKGAGNLDDFMKQRVRIYRGHLSLKARGYQVPTMNYLNLIKATLRATETNYLTMIKTTYYEMLARRKAKRLQDLTIWDMANSTKELK